MATRMQQRRGLASAWTAANTVLASGEVGFETDTTQFKVGDGTTAWTSLPYFKNFTSTNTVIETKVAAEATARDTAIETATTQILADAAAASEEYTDEQIGLEVSARNGAISTALGTAGTTAQGYVDTHASDTTNVHGISDTSALATKAGIETLTNKTISAADNTVTVNLADVIDVTASVSELNILDGATLTTTELNYVDGVTSAIQTQLDAKAPLAAPALTGNATAENLTVTGNLTVSGTTTTVDATNLEVTDSLIYLAAEQFDTDVLDIGIFGAYGDAGAGHLHTGVVRDATDGKWKLISGAAEPTSNEVNFSGVTYDTLKLGAVEFSDGSQTKQGVPSITPISQKTDSYTVALSDRDSLVEVNSGSGKTITIPTNASVAFPVGTSIDILQTGSGQVTIAGSGGVTVNATPGLKLRTQWSSATLFKRATDTWVVYGDLTA